MSMKMKRAAALLSALTVAMGNLSLMSVSAAVNPEGSAAVVRKSRLSMPSDASISLSAPVFKSIIGQDLNSFEDLVPRAAYEGITEDTVITDETIVLPEEYDMRSEGKITSVKNQGSYAACWTFASAASAETSLLKYEPSVDLSEWHTAFYTYYGEEQTSLEGMTTAEKLQYGGNCFSVANLWAQWKGPVKEEKLPYGNTQLFDDSYTVGRYENAADYHLENAYLFDYNADGSNRQQVNSLIKQFICSGSAVDVSFSTNGYNYAYNSAYSTTSPMLADHSVTIAGWDDNFPVENFKSGSRPSGSGAWLVRNSWDVGFGDNGYFWISYEDTSLCEFAVFDIESKEEYSKNYQHDSFVPTATMSSDEDESVNKPSYMANVFKAEEAEQLEAISTYIMNPGTEYEITVYTDLADVNDPSSGTASSVTTGISDLTGYITIELAEDVKLEADEEFAVAVKMYCEDSKYVLPAESSLVICDENDVVQADLGNYSTYEQICDYTNAGESFYSEDGLSWHDITDKNFQYTEEEKNELLESIIEANSEILTETQIEEYRSLFGMGDLVLVMGNLSLKAFTNPCDTIDFSHASGNVPLDERVELSVKDGSDIYYSVNGGAEVLYTEPLEITEKTTIKATKDHRSYTTREYSPAEAELIYLGYYTPTSYVTSDDIYKAERVDESTYNINLTGNKPSIELFFVSEADITMNGAAAEKNVFLEAIEIGYGLQTVELTLTQENRLDNTVTINIYRSPVDIDLETETVLLNTAKELVAADGHSFVNYESVSEYAGQTLTATIDDGTAIDVQVPERAVMPELEIDYYNETLNFLPNDIAERTEYAVKASPADSDYINAESRCIDGQNITSGKIMNKAFRIIPGETLTLRIAAGGGMFASEPVEYIIPEAPQAPTEKPVYTAADGAVTIEYSDTLECGAPVQAVTAEEFAESAEGFGYDVDTYKELMYARYGLSDEAELYSVCAALWDTIFEFETNGQPLIIPYRSYATESAFASQIAYLEIEGILKGDVNGDGKITATDAATVLAYYAKQSVNKAPELTEDEFTAYDVTGDGVITAVDAAEILKIYAENAVS